MVEKKDAGQKLVILEKDQFLMREGEESKKMYWLQSGQMVVVKSRKYEEVVLGHIYSGELVGEMSFLDGEPRSASVKALIECELIEIPQDAFTKIVQSQPKWFQTLLKTLCERLRKANARIKV